MENATVKQIMTKKIITIGADETLSTASEIMDNNKFRHLPVVEEGKLIGILSRTDLLRLGFNDRLGDLESQIGSNLYDVLTVGQVMVAHPMFISEETPLAEASKKMIDEQFNALPVVDSENKLSGIITTSDALNFYISN